MLYFVRNLNNLTMYLTEPSNFRSFPTFGFGRKRSPSTDLDRIIRSFEENLIRRLKLLISSEDQPSISLSWLFLAVDLLSSTLVDSETLISDLRSSSSCEDSLVWYLDESVKILDVCNSISAEIERLRQGRLLIQFVLHLLSFSGEDRKIPSPEKLRRARDSISGWKNRSPVIKRGNLQNPLTLIRDLAHAIDNPPRGKISTVGKIIHRTIYAVGAMTVFVTGVVVAALTESPEMTQVRVSSEFLWAGTFNDLESAVSREINRRFSGEKKRLIDDLDDVEGRARSVCDVIDGVLGRVDGGGEREIERLETAVKELEKVTGTFSDGLDRLFNGVNGFFHSVLCTRNGLLENFRVGPQTKRIK